MTTSTVKFHRVLRAKPERVCKAFLDAEALAQLATLVDPEIPG